MRAFFLSKLCIESLVHEVKIAATLKKQQLQNTPFKRSFSKNANKDYFV